MAGGPLDLGGLTIVELAKRTWAEMSDDGMFDVAAQLAYYFMLALFPLIIFLISLLSTIQALDLVNTVMSTIRDVMPPQAFAVLGGEIERIMSEPREGLLTFGVIGTLWAASSGVVSLLGSLDRAYDVKETRGFVKLRVTAVGLTVALALLIITGAVMLMAGDRISTWVAELTGMGWIAIAGTIVHYLIGLACILLGLGLIYYYGPDVPEQKWAWISPGAAVAAILFVLSSVGFSLYVRFSDSYTATYGSLGAIIILMLWLYLLGLAVTTGAEINSEIAIAAAKRGEADAPEVQPGLKASAEDGKAAEDMPVRSGQPGGAQSAPAGAPAVASGGASPERAVKAAVADLIEMLEYENSHVRAGAVAALRSAGPANPSILPVLAKALEDESPEVRKEAVKTLASMGTVSVPTIVRGLEDRDRMVRLQAAKSLGELGPGAKAALPALNVAAGESEFAEAALDAFKKIDRVDPHEPTSGVRSAA
jgi:membrane protein